MGEKIIAGVDEAGRGCVIGPLVVAGISIPHDKEEELKRIGVKDSKELPHTKREKLAKQIEEIAKDVIVFKVGSCKIDTFRKQGVSMNRIEAMKFSDIIRMLNPHMAYIDCPDTNINKFHLFMNKLVGGGPELIVKHKADRDYPVVSAASIIAKVERELEISKLKEEYGDFGTGYTSDERTIEWLRGWLKENKEFPEHLVRRSWITSSVLKGEQEQTNLVGWFRDLLKK
ncbi:MAG: ribonuclease HII [Candidatus Aenigmarchaeota archaeon]|nr:ribonuclease HII [Candidatus Aenigmarchaeota archaeon]